MMALEDKKMMTMAWEDKMIMAWVDKVMTDDGLGEHLQPGVPLVSGLVGLDNKAWIGQVH